MTRDLIETALTQGESTLMGDIPRASNATSLVVVESGEHTLKAVYKPMSGERPLRDFPRGTLGLREVASYRLSRHLDLGVVPPTVLRTDLPAGPGSLQAYVEDAGDDDPVALTGVAEIPDGYVPMFALRTEEGRDLVLSHSLGAGLRRIAFFDLLVGNADRKAGHIITGSTLPGDPDAESTYGIDNGLSCHTGETLRTVRWGVAGAASECLAPAEISALTDRAVALTEAGAFPEPPGDRTVIPWPPI